VETIKSLYAPACFKWPGEVKEIMVNMAFNLGQTGLKTFIVLGNILRKDVRTSEDWAKAACDMAVSCWYCQVGCRAVRLITRMLNMANISRGSWLCENNDNNCPQTRTLTGFTKDSCCFPDNKPNCFTNYFTFQVRKCKDYGECCEEKKKN